MGNDVVIVRLIHIFAGIIWVGVGFSATLILGSIVRSLGPQKASSIVRAWYLNSPFLKVVPAAAITTTLTGLYLYGRVYDGAQHVRLSETGSMVLSVGALFGLLAFGHGMYVGRLGSKYAAIAREAGDSPTPEQIGAMAAIGQKVAKNGPIISGLMFIAVIGMSLPRYIG